MTETVTRRELDRWQWICQVNQKLTFLILNVNNNKDITEEDWELLNMLYRDYERGVFPLYETVLDLKEQSVAEVGLFAGQSVSENSNGTLIDQVPSETKTEEEND